MTATNGGRPKKSGIVHRGGMVSPLRDSLAAEERNPSDRQSRRCRRAWYRYPRRAHCLAPRPQNYRGTGANPHPSVQHKYDARILKRFEKILTNRSYPIHVHTCGQLWESIERKTEGQTTKKILRFEFSRKKTMFGKQRGPCMAIRKS